MSIEFVGKIDATIERGSLIVDAVKASPDYQLLASSDAGRILLRFCAYPRRENWPEDATTLLQPAQIGLLFHGGSRDDRAALIRLLETTFGKVGYPVKFVED